MRDAGSAFGHVKLQTSSLSRGSGEGGSGSKRRHRSRESVDASGLKLAGAAGVTLQQADDGRVALGSFDELL